MPELWEIPVQDTTRVHDARVAAETAAQQAGLGPDRVAAAALVATELATNLLKHAGGGRILIDEVACGPAGQPHHDEPVVQIVAVDHGPGMPDVARALRDGYSTTASLGAGLGTCRRLADAFQVHSTVGRGTVALARLTVKGDRRPPAAPVDAPVRVGGIRVALGAARSSGDAWTSVLRQDRFVVLLADGLGHGPAAAAAAHSAVTSLRNRPEHDPVGILDRLHAELRGTRGAAVAVASIDLRTETLLFAGIGNIGARTGHTDSWEHLLSHPGIAGAHRPARVPLRRAPWRPGSVLVMHTDGLPSRWEPPHDPVQHHYDPAVLASVILRDASSAALPARDDTTVTVVTDSRGGGA
ncbi:ATP-binding SpoIIE family protein phosphatase [Streptacidiphilus anmyonensis]|uniref:ATP-binding SpoIIE family protein phosphatase n=1 Tax=Streptacidiphilus anmyonensis TaxID=405782 RepID=UPI0005AAEC3A|nr:ATP-binding SpoIIE family protein phosphatase [Streptacidiphilus anmyonensis]